MALSAEENATLTQVGPGTPMGDLLRRYWHPIMAVGEFEETLIRPVRLLGEDLVLYRDGRGVYGLLNRFCAHRGTDLSRGFIEECGLRCARHGWLYDESGGCLEQPLETEPFAEEIKLSAYSVAEKAGMLWAYLGPQPAPLVPDWEPFSWDDGVVQIAFALLPCNWLQCQENSLDLPGAFSFDAPPKGIPVAAASVDELAYGFVCGHEEDGGRTTDQVSLWPNGQFSGDDRSCRFEWRVPVNDTSTLSVSWFIDRAAPGARLPAGRRLFYWWAELRDEKGEWITSHALNRKFTIWALQGEIVDRTREWLSEADRGVVMLRNRLFSQVELLHDGGEPKWVLRRAEENRRLPLPYHQERTAMPAFTSRSDADVGAEDAFPHLSGQPEEARKAYEKVRSTWKRGRVRAAGGNRKRKGDVPSNGS